VAGPDPAIQLTIEGIANFLDGRACPWTRSEGRSPAMTVETKFANVFIASSASGNIGVIKIFLARTPMTTSG
jgi:hypothetical protein